MLFEDFAVVTDRFASSVIRFDPGDGNLHDVFSDDPRLRLAEGVAFGPDQNLYVSSNITNDVLRYNGSTGEFLGSFIRPGSPLRSPTGLAFGPDGNLYVVSVLQAAVYRFDGLTGEYLGEFIRSGSGGLVNPNGITFGPDGNLYLTSGTPLANTPGQTVSPQILRFDGKTGAFDRIFVSTGSGGLNAPFSLIFGPDGNLYVSSVLTDSVIRYDGRTGALKDVFVAARSGGLGRPTGMAFGPDGNFYVCSSFGANIGVLRYDGNTGSFLSTFVPTGTGGIAGPTGILFYSFETRVFESGANATVASGDGGTQFLVFSDRGKIMGQMFEPNGVAASTPMTIAAATNATHDKPRVAPIGSGEFGVVWEATEASTSRTSVQFARIGSNGTSISTPVTVSPSTLPAGTSDLQPSIARGPQGGASVVWTREGAASSSARAIRGRTIGSDGRLGAEVPITGGTARDEAAVIAADPGGNAAVTWISVSNGVSRVMAQMFDGSLHATAGATTLDDGISGAATRPAAAYAGGQFAVAWAKATATNPQIMYRRISAAGTPLSNANVVSLSPSRSAAAPSIGGTTSGRVAIAWQYTTAGRGSGIYGRFLDQASNPEKTEFVVTDSTTANDVFTAPSLTLGATDSLTVVSAKVDASASAGIYARVRKVPSSSSSPRRRAVRKN